MFIVTRQHQLININVTINKYLSLSFGKMSPYQSSLLPVIFDSNETTQLQLTIGFLVVHLCRICFVSKMFFISK